MNIFPKLKGSWAKTNLDEDSRKTGLDFSIPEVCQNWINKLCSEKKVSYIYGGYLEDRTHLWKNKESESANSLIHLGIDYSVPAGTEVAMPEDGEVFHIMNDPTNTIGWGGRIIFKLDNGKYLVYGHLKQNINLKIG
nr:hypothetical protein [Candidatus Pacearchaeota archaeon]